MVVGFTQLLGHSVFTSYPECFLLLFPQGPGAGAVREEASLEGGTAECLCSSGKKHHTPCPGAAEGTEGDTCQPGLYPFHFPVPGHVITLGLSFSDLSLPASQAFQGGIGCWYLSHAWVLEHRSWPVQVSVFKTMHAGGDRGKIFTWSWVKEGLGCVVGVAGKDTSGYWVQNFSDLAGKGISSVGMKQSNMLWRARRRRVCREGKAGRSSRNSRGVIAETTY